MGWAILHAKPYTYIKVSLDYSKTPRDRVDKGAEKERGAPGRRGQGQGGRVRGWVHQSLQLHHRTRSEIAVVLRCFWICCASGRLIATTWSQVWHLSIWYMASIGLGIFNGSVTPI